jgi:hypothetical protein
MLDKLKSLFAGRATALVPLADQIPNLPSRPFTYALLLRAAHLSDEAVRDLRKMVGQTPPLAALPTLDAKIRSAVSVVACQIVADAKEVATGQSIYMPGGKLPKDAQLVAAFGFLVIAAIARPVREEGCELDNREICADLINSMFMMHTLEERTEVYRQAASIVVEVSKVDLPNVREWTDNLFQLVGGYICQFTSADVRLTQTKFSPLFGSMLKTFLSSAT